ncbi:MAG TPA: serine hydrolase [Stellaceae bacterium]|nr:serine hydrolase [Stellaceae bacterium]
MRVFAVPDAKFAFLMLCLIFAPAIAAANCGAPADLHDGWKAAAPAQEGLDPRLICAIGPHLEKLTDADPNGVVVVRHDVLVYEHYFGANPLAYNATTVHRLASVTKSVVAILVGIAFDRGWLKSLDAPVFSFFPQYADLRTPDKNRITLRDLLTMTSGLAWPELAVSYNNPANIVRRAAAALDPYRFVLAQPLAATPGTIWNYNSGGVELLGIILKKVAKRPLDMFAKEALFDPLGIKHWEWAQFHGNPIASAGLRLRPRDLAKIGQLVLDRGTWHDRQIVSADWIKGMTAPQLPRWYLFQIGGAYSYGYLWWLGRPWIDGQRFDWVGGLGYGGQRLYVVPSRDLVVAVTAGVYGHSYAQNLAGNTTLDMVLRAALQR